MGAEQNNTLWTSKELILDVMYIAIKFRSHSLHTHGVLTANAQEYRAKRGLSNKITYFHSGHVKRY